MPPHVVVVVGSINMDLVVRVPRLPRPGETLHARDFRAIPGGKGANQAVAAARLGARVTMIGKVGDDAYGSRLIEGLAGEGVNVEHVAVAPGCPSGQAVIAVDDAGQNSIMVVPGANQLLTPDDVLRHEDAIGFGGVMLVQLEVPLETVAAALQLARAKEFVTILDPAPAPDAALPRDLLCADFLTPNQSEAAALTGIDSDSTEGAERAAATLRESGARLVVVKRGADGALLSSSSRGNISVPTFPVPVVDTTAAGDAFNAGLAVALAELRTIPNAVHFACAAGALATTRPGAQPAMPSRAEVDDLMARWLKAHKSSKPFPPGDSC
ncbi:MAG: ribokinase [Planctomycetes bacterium]|nr:ribokinase [Planctomycetota bacterium]